MIVLHVIIIICLGLKQKIQQIALKNVKINIILYHIDNIIAEKMNNAQIEANLLIKEKFNFFLDNKYKF